MRRAANVDFRLLGPVEVVHDDRTLELPGGRARSLLALLALRPGEVLSTDRLLDALWGQAPPPTATTALQGHVSTLRKRLEPERRRGAPSTVIITHPPGYVLAVDREQVDAHRFRRLVDGAIGAPPPERARRLRAALALWRGPALADLTYEPFAQAPITALEELRVSALEARIEADLELGHHTQVVAELEELVLEHPLREGLHAHLMLALYRCDRQAAALQVYAHIRRHLVDELGIEPGPELQNLQRAILDQDPSLDAPETVAVPDTAPEELVAGSRWLDVGRRLVTVMFVDLSVSVPTIGADADPEAIRPIVSRARAAVRAIVERHGGTLEGVVGDVAVVVFGLPVAHEDDVVRAVRAAASIRHELVVADEDGPRLAARVGIHTGEVVVGDPAVGGTATSGPPVAVAARLQQVADDGVVLLSDPARRLVQDIALVEPVPSTGSGPRAWRLIDVVEEPTGLVAADTSHVGREHELTELAEALERTVRGGRAALVTVLGEAGVGKSRLARAFTAEVAGARAVVGRCRAYGDGITFWPLREIVQDLVGGTGVQGLAEMLSGEVDGPANAEQIASAVGLSADPAGHAAELFRAVRQLLEVAARDEPLVAIVEDAHWAEPTLLDLIEYLADEVLEPVLLLCLARPDLVESRPTWASGRATATTIELRPLATTEARRLVSERLGGRLLAPETIGRILAMAQGNPLFLEQLLAAVRDDHEVTLPPTVQALLTSRLDRLGPAERDVLRAASVIGTDVATDALTALVPTPARPYLERHLEALTAKELIGPREGSPTDPPGFDFRHVLIRQAAYRSLTLRARAELHERLADHLQVGAGSVEAPELVGHHLEQAFLHRRDLGRSDAETQRLAVRAGELLADAGLRAYARFDVPAAENLLSRARSLLPNDHRDRPRVLRRLTEAYPVMGRREAAEAAFRELLDLAERGGDDLTIRSVRLEQTRFRLITGPDPIPLATIQQEIGEALDAFQRAGDDVGVSQAHYALASVHLRAGRMAELEEVGWQAIERARHTGDLRERLGAAWWVVFAMLEGPTPVPDCIRACEEIADVGGLAHLGVLAAIGHFRAMLGEIEEGRKQIGRAREILREQIRVPRPLAFIGQRQAGIELLAGQTDAAVHALSEALDVSLRVAERDQSSQIAARLSLVLAGRGAVAEAAELATVAWNQAPSESVTAQALARAARARAALEVGDTARGGTLSREAIDDVPADMLDLRALLHVGLAEVVAAAGREDEARSITDQAVELYEMKGNLVAAERVRDRCRR